MSRDFSGQESHARWSFLRHRCNAPEPDAAGISRTYPCAYCTRNHAPASWDFLASTCTAENVALKADDLAEVLGVFKVAQNSFFYKNLQPPDLVSAFALWSSQSTPSTGSMSLRSSGFCLPWPRTGVMRCSLFYQAFSIWNSLSAECQSSRARVKAAFLFPWMVACSLLLHPLFFNL